MPLPFALKLLKISSLLMLMLFSLSGYAVDTDNDGLPDDWENWVFVSGFPKSSRYVLGWSKD